MAENMFSRPEGYISPEDRLRGLSTRGQMSYPEPTPPDTGFEGSPVIDTRSWGERHSGGARPGGNTFGGYRTDRPRAGTVEGTPVVPGAPSTPGQSPYGNNRFGGNTFGGNTFGGNTFGGNRFGASSRGPGETGGQPEPTEWPPTRPEAHDESQGTGQRIIDEPTRPTAHDESQGTGQRITEPESKPDQDEASFRPGPLPKKPGAGGGGAGGGAGRGRRKALGDQSRTEAYDPTLDRADPRNVAPVDEKYRVNPKLWEDAQKGAIDPTKPGVRTGEKAQAYTNNYTAALEGATNYMAEMFHQKKGDPNQGEGYAAMTFKGVGAPDPNIVAGVFNVVDPKNEMQPKERMELATRAMHDWYVAKGDKKSADKVAAEMLQYGNKQAQVLGKQALENIKAGNKDAAVAAIKQAYDWLPDGFHADVAGNKLTITNDKNQVVNSFDLDDKQIANLGTGLATGTLFWDVVQDRAGKPGTFAPPTAQPQQAIAATAPSGPPGGSPPATAQAPPPSPPGAPQAPAAAGPPLSATPSAPPGAPPGPPRPPGPPPSGPPGPPGPAPAPPSGPPPVPVTPPSNRPAAPVPAAPVPAPPAQATPSPVPATPPAPAQALSPTVPPPLQGPVQPTTTKRPIVDEKPEVTAQPPQQPAQGSGGPPGSPAGQPPAGQPQAQAEPKPGQAKPNEPVWDTNDPDTVPKINGKPAIVRRETYPASDEVKAARQQIAQADAKYKADQDWLAFKQKTGKGTAEYQRTMVQLKDDIEKTHKNSIARADSIVREHTAAERAHDAQERASLKPRHLEGTALERAETIAKAHFANEVDKKTDVFKNSALRLYDTPEKQTPLIDAVSKIQAINPNVSTKKIAELVTTAVTHVGSGEGAKKDSMNDNAGPKGSRFLVVGEDLARNPVIVIGHGNSRVQLHVPKDTLNDLKRLKTESYKDVEKKLTDETNKPKTDYSTLVPGRITETIADVKEVVKGAQEKQKAEGRDMKPDAPQTTEGKTTQQIQEEQRKRRRQAPSSPTSNVEP